VDLAYLRAYPRQLPTFLRHQRIRETPLPGGSICQARRLTLADGTSVFVKFLQDPTEWDPTGGGSAPDGFFEAEARGLAWLGETGGVAVPDVIAVLPGLLALEWVESAEPSVVAAERFGRDLAATHQVAVESFGAPWPGFIGLAAQPNDIPRPAGKTATSTWAEFFAEARLRVHLRTARDRGALSAADVAAVERVLSRLDDLAGPPEPPARIHGDLHPGNLLWAGDPSAAGTRVFLVDPSAHGGHRETDLANLALFGGAPYLPRIVAAYDEAWPLADGWRARIPLHQLHLLLVHAALFGPGYRTAVMASVDALR
jgi:fructosamine-3-kinase